MNPRLFTVLATIGILLAVFGLPQEGQGQYYNASYHTKARGGKTLSLSLHSPHQIQALYRQRDGRPLWKGHARHWSNAAQQLIEELAQLRWDGINPKYFHLPSLKHLLNQPWSPTTEIWFTDAAITAGQALLYGQTRNASAWPSHWQQAEEDIAVSALMLRAIQQGRIKEGFRVLRPQYTAYRKLRQKLRSLQTPKKLWPDSLRLSKTLKLGDSGPAVPALRHRLIRSGDWTVQQLLTYDSHPEPHYFDPALRAAVQSFQRRHGLIPDGIVGPKTRAKLNRSPDQLQQLLRLNLERWRWLPRQQPPKWVEVNLPEYRVRGMIDGKAVWSSKIIVGKAWNPTPLFTDTIQHAVFAPYWNIPYSIAIYDKLPKIQQDSAFFREMGMEVYSAGPGGGELLSADEVAWDSLGPGHFPYRLRQQPGPKNSLGEVKFLFPNQFSVYLHGTPKTHLFEAARRTFSAGCVRVAQPLELARFLLPEKHTTIQKIENKLQQGQYQEQWIGLSQTVPVFITHQTAWVENGQLHTRPDVYEYDQQLTQIWHDGPGQKRWVRNLLLPEKRWEHNRPKDLF